MQIFNPLDFVDVFIQIVDGNNKLCINNIQSAAMIFEFG